MMKAIIFSCILLFCLSFGAMATPLKRVSAIDTLKKGENYFLFSKTENIASVSFNKSKKAKENIVYIRFGYPTVIPTSNAIKSNVISSKRYGEESKAPVFDKIDIIKGNYTDIVMSTDTKVRNLFTLTGVEFPLQLRLKSGNEMIDLQLTEQGEWKIGIELKNN